MIAKQGAHSNKENKYSGKRIRMEADESVRPAGDCFQQLPDEVISKVFGQLDLNFVTKTCAKVSKRWLRIAR